MNSNEENNYIRKDLQILSDKKLIEKNDIIYTDNKNKILIGNTDEEEYQKDNEVILNQENDNNYAYDDDIIDSNINEVFNKDKNKFYKNERKQQIYTKLKTETYRNSRMQINNYIYKSGKRNFIPKKNNLTSNINNYYLNTAKYSIKNPIKEKSKNKLKNYKIPRQSTINETDIYNNNNSNYNYKLNLNEISNIDNLKNENNNYINRTNYNINIDTDTNEFKNINLDTNNPNIIEDVVIKSKKSKKIKKINQAKKRSYMPFNTFNKLLDEDYPPNTTKAGRITYIYDISQENNKNSYYIETPTATNHMNIYPIENKIKKRRKKMEENNKNKDGLLKKIEDSKKNFEKILEIEREIKNYFNINGLNIINRDLYDSSATMIQSAFRAFFSRKKLYEELNLYLSIKNGIDILNEIFISKKNIYFELFINKILEFISIINTNIDNGENIVNLKNDKYQYLNQEFNDIEGYNIKNNINEVKYIKKKPIPYKQISKSKKLNDNNYMILKPQLCISFDLLNNQDKIFNKNNNIIKDTQASVELKLSEELKQITYNKNKNETKLFQLKYVLKLLGLKYQDIINKKLLKFFNNLILLKYNNIANSKINKRNKILKRYIINKEKENKKFMDKYFILFYYKGLINEIKNNNSNNNNNELNNEKDNELVKSEEIVNINDEEDKKI